MDTKWRKYSHSLAAKVLVFIIAILCFTSTLTILSDVVGVQRNNFDIAFEDSYYQGQDYINDSINIVQSLTAIIGDYKNEAHVLNGGSLTEDEILDRENELFRDFRFNSKAYNPNLSEAENYKVFKEVYASKILEQKNRLIKEDLRRFRETLKGLDQYPGLIYYAKSGETIFTNSPDQAKEYFKSFPSYMIFDGSEQKVFPEEIENNNNNYSWIRPYTDQIGLQDVVYVAFTEEFINPRMAEWKQDKNLVTVSLKQIAGFASALVLAFIYLVLVIGRKPEDEGRVLLNSIDRIYTDINLGMCMVFTGLWAGTISELYHSKIYELTFPLTLLIAVPGLILVLSLVKHIKNRTLITHTLTYTIFYKLFQFIKDIYNSGNVAVKVVLIVIGYPIIVAVTFFIFPITIGAAAWLAFKKVKEFNALKEGVEHVKNGDLNYTLNLPGDGELAKLAADINTITDGLNKAVENEIKSERLKSELITNVSHDIRTPLTSIITYVDLLKNEKDQDKAAEYIDIIDQKSQRLKILTEDLFEATKASSGNIPVNYEKIDIVSLLTQGLGELDDKIQGRRLEFKLNYPSDKIYIQADGKLLWRAIENLLFNILKYALEGSRVYIDIMDAGSQITLTIKNISAYELNIPSAQLMERFKRGDESRTSQGSGLGLSIAQSLIEIQKGSFNIEIDGDLFKAIIQMPKQKQEIL